MKKITRVCKPDWEKEFDIRKTKTWSRCGIGFSETLSGRYIANTIAANLEKLGK